MKEALHIHVSGIVQGVGFRPFVYRMAKRHLICGWVLNATDGVNIHAEAEASLLDAFVLAISEEAPAAAHITEIELTEVPLQDCERFEIRFSSSAHASETTFVSADLATCDECLRELFDPNDRRFRYPFINCTNCGPRFTITEKLPYDRANTSMTPFAMCTQCAAEYADVANRRFHAQPDACFDCGPHVSFIVPTHPDNNSLLSDTYTPAPQSISWGNTREESDAIFSAATALLHAGGILALKGLGGFHLVCDAYNTVAVAQLRARKHRDNKAFAVMVDSIDAARLVCHVSDEEAHLLSSPARPIVLLRKRSDADIAPGIADGLPELGVMLPCTPVQHLLLHDFAMSAPQNTRKRTMLVMTSGNIHDEPIVIDDDDAREKLLGIADAILGNDRAILSRYDDSVLRVIRIGTNQSAIQMIRRARGYAPVPLDIPVFDETTDGISGISGISEIAPTLLAVGPEQKNTLCFVREKTAFVSQHIGDLENAETFDAWLAAKKRLEMLFEVTPEHLACDMHPEYLSTKWAHEASRTNAQTLCEVQHHHAHIASVLGEHNTFGPVCGIAFDGTGYGSDSAIWGGEVLIANALDFERFANFAYMPMPGGAACVKHPLRMAYGVLCACDLLEHPGAQRALHALGQSTADICQHMIDHSLNTPYTSSVGRLFDAASALLGICTEPTYEGEAAIALEAALPYMNAANSTSATDPRYAISIIKNTATPQSTAHDTSVLLLDPAHTFHALLDDAASGVAIAIIAQRFHDAFVQAIVDIALCAEQLYDIRSVALSGGVFMNRFLTEHALESLNREGFTVLINRDLPPNDGCIAYGQAVVACAQKTSIKAEG